MTQKEFTERTGINLPESLFWEVHEEYCNSNLDKDAFCKQWVRNGGRETSTEKMLNMMSNLQAQLDRSQVNRATERDHFEKKLKNAYVTSNAFATEIERIFNLETDEQRNIVLTSIVENYKRRIGYAK